MNQKRVFFIHGAERTTRLLTETEKNERSCFGERKEETEREGKEKFMETGTREIRSTREEGGEIFP